MGDRKLQAMQAVLDARSSDPDLLELLLSLRFREQVAVAKAGFLAAYGALLANLSYNVYHGSGYTTSCLTALLMVGFAFLFVALLILLLSFFAFESYGDAKTAREYVSHFAQRDLRKEKSAEFSARLILAATALLVPISIYLAFFSELPSN